MAAGSKLQPERIARREYRRSVDGFAEFAAASSHRQFWLDVLEAGTSEQHLLERLLALGKSLGELETPLLEETDSLVDAGEPVEATVDNEDDDAVEEEEDDDLPDLLLRESARIVADMIELGSDEPALARQFSALDKDQGSDTIN